MRLLLHPCFVALSVTVLLLVGLSRSVAHGEEAPTIVPRDDHSPTILTETTPTDNSIERKRTAPSALEFLKDCRRAGFDPMQLACTTCAILPNNVNDELQRKCGECCQSYKTLEKRSRRYEMAVLFNTGYPEAVRELVRDDTDKILEQKGSTRFHVQDFGSAHAEMGMMGMMGMFQQEPSAILWFDTPIHLEDVSTDELATQADEITVLGGRGLGRDDIRDMLLALLPDKE